MVAGVSVVARGDDEYDDEYKFKRKQIKVCSRGWAAGMVRALLRALRGGRERVRASVCVCVCFEINTGIDAIIAI